MFKEKSIVADEQEMDEKLKEYLVLELGRSFLTVPFDIWFYICKKTREKICGRFPHIELEPMTEEDARLWYTRYCFHCDDNCLSFLKSVVTGYPNFKWPEEVEQLIKIRCFREEIIAKRVKQEEQEYSPESKRKRYRKSKSGDYNPNDLYDPAASGSSCYISDDEDQRENFIMPKKKRISHDISFGHNPEPPSGQNVESSGSLGGNNSTDSRLGPFIPSALNSAALSVKVVENNSPCVFPTGVKKVNTPEKLNFRNQKLDSIVVTIPNVSPAPISNTEKGVPVNNNFETQIHSSDSIVNDISCLQFLDVSHTPPGFVPEAVPARKQLRKGPDIGKASLNANLLSVNPRIPSAAGETLQCSEVTSPSVGNLSDNVNKTVPLFSPREEQPVSPKTPRLSAASSKPTRARAFSPVNEPGGLYKLLQYSGTSSSSSNVSLGSGSKSSKEEPIMKEQTYWRTPRLILELPLDEIEARRAAHLKNHPQGFTVSIVHDDDQTDPRMSAATSFYLQRCLDIKKEIASKILIEFDRRDSVETDRMEDISSVSTVSSEDKSRNNGKVETSETIENRNGKDEQELCYAKSFVNLDIDMGAVEEESSSEGDDMDPVDFEKTYVRRRKEEPEPGLISVSRSIFEEQQSSPEYTPDSNNICTQSSKVNPVFDTHNSESTNFLNLIFEELNSQKQLVPQQHTTNPIINIDKAPQKVDDARLHGAMKLVRVHPPAESTSSVATVRLSDYQRIASSKNKIPRGGSHNPHAPVSVRPSQTSSHFHSGSQAFHPDGNFTYRPRTSCRAPISSNQILVPGAFSNRCPKFQRFRRP